MRRLWGGTPALFFYSGSEVLAKKVLSNGAFYHFAVRLRRENSRERRKATARAELLSLSRAPGRGPALLPEGGGVAEAPLAWQGAQAPCTAETIRSRRDGPERTKRPPTPFRRAPMRRAAAEKRPWSRGLAARGWPPASNRPGSAAPRIPATPPFRGGGGGGNAGGGSDRASGRQGLAPRPMMGLPTNPYPQCKGFNNNPSATPLGRELFYMYYFYISTSCLLDLCITFLCG
eukprot:gene2165-1334_t